MAICNTWKNLKHRMYLNYIPFSNRKPPQLVSWGKYPIKWSLNSFWHTLRVWNHYLVTQPSFMQLFLQKLSCGNSFLVPECQTEKSVLPHRFLPFILLCIKQTWHFLSCTLSSGTSHPLPQLLNASITLSAAWATATVKNEIEFKLCIVTLIKTCLRNNDLVYEL